MVCDKTLGRGKKAKNANNKFSVHDSFLDKLHQVSSKTTYLKARGSTRFRMVNFDHNNISNKPCQY